MFLRKIATSIGTRYKTVSSLEGIFSQTKQNAHLLDALSKENPTVVSKVEECLTLPCQKKPK